ncbi:c-type cytochrome biogenesis protein CcsB [Nesterenkonia halobia]|uniref:C-type cytochrome biogenesis protein CcsB n=1 Tax=Nesterenkonia halobia TaxID=37922 RepID=A0ABP6R642_9MICC
MPTFTGSIDQELAQYSDLFMLIAALIYTGAFLMFALDIARSSVTIRRLEADLAAEQEAERAERSAQIRATAPAGAGSSAAGSADAGGSDAGDPDEAPGAVEASAEDLVDDEMTYTGIARPLANVAVALTILAALAHGFAVGARATAAGRVPWGNMYEFLTTGAFVVAAVYLVSLLRKDLRFLGTFAVGLVVVMMTAATIGFPTPLGHLQPSLQSPWIVIHVSVAVFSMGLFTLTFAMSVLQLIQHRREAKRAAGMLSDTGGWQFMRMVPSAMALENRAYRINTIGFVTWTLTLIFGAIWAEEAWGRYWGWDTKEVWTFVVWVVYAGYLHARATRGWTGSRSAWLSIIGFACVIFNFTVVNTLFAGLHSYAGLPE